jgi:membrane-bound ClpP family serine protease
VLKAVVANPIVAGILMGIPIYFLLTVLLLNGTKVTFTAEFFTFENNAAGPFYTLLGLAIFAWMLELVALKFMIPTLMGICGFGHSAVGSWWLVNFAILFLGGWYYIPIRIMFIILLNVLTPAIIWHITGDIIRASKEKLIKDIEEQNKGMAAQVVLPGNGEAV